VLEALLVVVCWEVLLAVLLVALLGERELLRLWLHLQRQWG